MQATVQVMKRPRPSIHIHRPLENAYYNVEQPQFLGSRKRKRSSNYSSEEEEDAGAPHIYPQPSSPLKSTSPSAGDDGETDHKNKRARRALNIEKGMGGMSLNRHVFPTSVETTSHHLPARPSYDHLNKHFVSEPEHLEVDEDFGFRDDHLDGGEDLEVVTPNVEEAVSPIVRISGGSNQHLNYRQSDDNDVNMKTASWYEPEKDRESHSAHHMDRDNIDQVPIRPRRTGIIITDLSDSETEQEDAGAITPESWYWDGDEGRDVQRPGPSFTVSSAYLQRFSTVPKPLLPQVGSQNSMALVAYRPVPYLPIQMDRVGERKGATSAKLPEDHRDASDVMDIDE